MVLFLLMKLSLIILVVLSCLFANSTSYAQQCNGSLSGNILDDHDRTRLEYAAIYIKETGQSALSDSTGHYRIEGLCDGIYTVRVTHLGCDDLLQTVRIKGATSMDFHPEHHTEDLHTVHITATRIADRTTQTTVLLDKQELARSRGLTLGESLREISGVTTLNTGNSIAKPVIHGLHSNRILVLNNGIRQESQQWGSEHAPEIDPFIASRLGVIKGAAGVRYGPDAIAGVVIAEPAPLPDSPGIGGELNLVGASNGRSGTLSGTLEGNHAVLPSLSWRVQGTLKKSGNVRSPDYYLKNTGLVEADFSGALGWKKDRYGADLYYSQFNTTLGIFSASHIGNLTDLQKAFDSNAPLETSGFSYEIDRPYQQIRHDLLKANAWMSTGEAGKLSVVFARQYNLRDEYDKHLPLSDSLAGLDRPQLHYEITSYTTDVIWEHRNIGGVTGSIGVSGLWQANATEGRLFIPNFENDRYGAFVIERFKQADYELEVGIRYDAQHFSAYRWIYTNGDYQLTNPQRDFSNLSGTIGVIWKADSSLTINFNAGTAWRAPSVAELYSSGLHHGAAAVEFGDAELLTEKAFNTTLSAQYRKGSIFQAEATVYCNPIRDFIYLRPELPPTLTIRGAFPTFYYRQTDALLSGLDITAQYRPWRKLNIIGRGSLLRARNVRDKEWLVMMPADRVELEIDFLPTSRSRVRENVVGIVAQYVAEQTRVPVNSDFVAPPPAYLLFHLEASTMLQWNRQQLVIGLSVRNLLDTKYRDYLDRFRYYTDAMGRNIVLRLRMPLAFPKADKH